MQEQLLTIKEVAHIVNRSERSVRARKNLDHYLDSYESTDGPGRKAKLLKPSVVELWGLNPAELSQSAIRNNKPNDRRADYGVPRIYREIWHIIIPMIKKYYISAATPNLLEACRIASRMAAMDGVQFDGEKVYKNLTRNKTKTCTHRSVYYEENWEALYKRKSRRKEEALESFLSSRYNHFSMFKRAGLLGKGFGSRRVIVVDDFKRDVWVEKDGKMTMPWGLVFVDGITGYPLMVLPCESITSDVVAAGILMTAFAHGIHSDTFWVFETSRAMKNTNVIGLVESLYTKDELQAFKDDTDGPIAHLFDGQTGPYVHAPAMIARSVFKSKVERSIKHFKDEFDGLYFANTFQGGDRKEGVQLTLAGSPYDVLKYDKPGQDKQNLELLYSERLFPINGFWERFFNWVWGKFVQMPRPKMYKLFNQIFDEQDINTMEDVHNYFTSDDDGSFIPDVSDFNRIGMLLYYAQPERHKHTVKITQIGSYQTTINGRSMNIHCDSFTVGDVGKRVCTIPIPGESDKFIVVDVSDKDNPELLGVGEDFTAQTFQEANYQRRQVRSYRERLQNEMQKEVDENTIEIVDDLTYESNPPNAAKWTKQLAANSSQVYKEVEGDDDANEVDEFYEELEITTEKGKEFMKMLDDLDI